LAGDGHHDLAGVDSNDAASRHDEFFKLEGVGPRTASSVEHCLSRFQAESGETRSSLISKHLGLVIQKCNVRIAAA